VSSFLVTSNQFKRWLAAQGCTFESGKRRPPDRPVGGPEERVADARKRQELGTGLVNKIKKDLGLK